MSNILVIAAHPDDEVLGCGGTIAKHSERGDKVYIVIIAEGVTSRKMVGSENRSELRGLAESAHTAGEILGATRVELLRMPDNRLDTVARLDLTKTIEARIEEYQPAVVYTHHAGDVNVDHRRVHEAVVTACRPYPGNKINKLLSFEVASSTEWQPPGSGAPFVPNCFNEVGGQWKKKMDALRAYSGEMREWPHPRSISAVEYQGRLRGAQIGCEYAEAFMLLREIDS